VPLSASAHATTACFSAALGFMALHPSGFKANYMDVTTHHSGLVSGIGNTIASVASSVGPLWVSQVRESAGHWAPVFHSVASMNLLAALVFCTLSSTRPIEARDAHLQGRPAEEDQGLQLCPRAQFQGILARMRRRQRLDSRLVDPPKPMPVALVPRGDSCSWPPCGGGQGGRFGSVP